MEEFDASGNPISQPEPEAAQEAQPAGAVGPLSFLEGLAALVHEHADVKQRLAQVETLAQSIPGEEALAARVEALLSEKFRALLGG